MTVTPIALPDPPLLASSGCHGPYFLRNVVQLETDSGIIGIGETSGGKRTTQALEQARAIVEGHDAFSYRELGVRLGDSSTSCYAAIELACLDALGKATGRRVCELLGGPVRTQVEFAAYLFYRYAPDNPTILADPRIVDDRGKGDRALDSWGEVRSPETMAALADGFRKRFGFRVFKLKGGVLDPQQELESLQAMRDRLGKDALLRIDPNARWKVETALRIGGKLKDLNMEYYEDPVRGQAAMAEVRKQTGLPMSTNMCVTRFSHLPEAVKLKPIDVLLLDLHYWGGIVGCQAVGAFCDAAGWKGSQHSNNHAGVTMSAMIHMASVVPQLTLASDTHYPWLVDNADILEGPKLPIQNGRMSIPAGPGLGVRIDPDKLARAHEVYVKCGMTERDDASLMRKLEPGWTGRQL